MRLLPRIVCSAVRHPKGHIVLGIRHFDSHMHAAITSLQASQPSVFAGHHRWEQGFVDQYGTFYDREQAFKLATERGQIQAKTGNSTSTELFSEDLY